MIAAIATNGPTVLLDSPYDTTAPVNVLNTGLKLLQLPSGLIHISHGNMNDNVTVSRVVRSRYAKTRPTLLRISSATASA